MLAKLVRCSNTLDLIHSEQLSDTLFEIGKARLRYGEPEEATFWLERAHDELSRHEISRMSSDAGELKISIMHCTARAFMKQSDADHRARAWNIARDLELEGGDKLALSMLKLDLYALEPESVAPEYFDVLEKTIGSIHLTESNIKTVLFHAHQLKTWNPRLAQDLLTKFIYARLLDAGQPELLEKALITVVWFATASSVLKETACSLDNLFDNVSVSSSKPLSPAATHSVHILLWKQIDSFQHQEKFDLAELWCHLALHRIFEVSGARHIGKLQRKLMQCALSQASPSKARMVFNQMSTASQAEPSTQFLLYKVALRCHDNNLATQCLESICHAENVDTSIMYACVLEAQQSGDQHQSLAALQGLLKAQNSHLSGNVHIPALLRCAIRMLVQHIGKDGTPAEDSLSDLCDIFERAVRQAKAFSNEPPLEHSPLFALAELDWFSRNSYNLALKHLSTWPFQITTRLIQSCIGYIELYPTELENDKADDLHVRRMSCNFLAASLYTVMARREDVVEIRLQHYLAVRHAAEAFRDLIVERMNDLFECSNDDLRHKFISILVYDFEAAARLKLWDVLGHLIKVCYKACWQRMKLSGFIGSPGVCRRCRVRHPSGHRHGI